MDTWCLVLSSAPNRWSSQCNCRHMVNLGLKSVNTTNLPTHICMTFVKFLIKILCKNYGSNLSSSYLFGAGKLARTQQEPSGTATKLKNNSFKKSIAHPSNSLTSWTGCFSMDPTPGHMAGRGGPPIGPIIIPGGPTIRGRPPIRRNGGMPRPRR